MNWMKYTPLYFLISALIIIPGVYSLAKYGLRLSIEFTGGAVYQIENYQGSENDLLSALSSLRPAITATAKEGITLRSGEISESDLNNLLVPLKNTSKDLKVSSFEVIGPALGQETINKTLTALLIASVLLLGYISFAFKQLKYGLCAILAMFHDTLVLLGSFSLLGHFFGLEVDLLFVTAVLTILSFSVHDTIVVYDRIRELSKKVRHMPFETLVNKAVTETMVRSLNNSLTIIFMLTALFLMGGESTRPFSLALLIGTITGTYSSTFTAAPLLVVYGKIFAKKN